MGKATQAGIQVHGEAGIDARHGLFEPVTLAVITVEQRNPAAQDEELAQQVQKATGSSVEVAFIDQGDTGEQPAQAGEAKKGLVLLPRRWDVER